MNKIIDQNLGDQSEDDQRTSITVKAMFNLAQFLPEGSDVEKYSADFQAYLDGIPMEEIIAKLQEFEGNYRALYNYYLWSFLTPNVTLSVEFDQTNVEPDSYYAEFWEGLMKEGRDAMADEA